MGMRHRLRFGLRGLAVAVTMAALGSYWLARPSLLAHQFVEAMDAGDYAAAEALFVRESPAVFPGNFATPKQLRETTVEVPPLTWQQVLYRQRQVFVRVPYGDGIQDWSWDISIIATPTGLTLAAASH